MNKIVLLFFIGTTCLLTAQNPSLESLKKETFKSGDLDRIYYLHLPEQLSKEAPLVFVLHGYGGSAKGMIDYSGMNAIADKHGFAVCYPQGNFGPDQKNSWNANYSNDAIDDVAFLTALAQYLQQEHTLSKQNTFCTGMSNGADMSYMLACARPDIFAAVAPVAGCMMQTTFDACRPAKAIPVFEIHGTKDSITLWEGDPEYSEKYGGYLGTLEIMDFWIKQNQCTQSTIDTLPDRNTEDGSFIISNKYSNPDSHQQVWLYTLQNGKHDWPGVWGNQDINTSEVIWNFFSQFLKK